MLECKQKRGLEFEASLEARLSHLTLQTGRASSQLQVDIKFVDFNHARAWLQASMWIKCISGVFTAASALSVPHQITTLQLVILYR